MYYNHDQNNTKINISGYTENFDISTVTFLTWLVTWLYLFLFCNMMYMSKSRLKNV